MQTSIDKTGKFIVISGNTFPYRQQIKDLGGKWDPTSKTWKFNIEFREQVENFVQESTPVTYVAAKPSEQSKSTKMPIVISKPSPIPQATFVYNTAWDKPIGINTDKYTSEALYMIGQVYHMILSSFNRVVLRYAKQKYNIDSRDSVLLANYRSDQLAISEQDIELETLAAYSWNHYPHIGENIRRELFKRIVTQLEQSDNITASTITSLIDNGFEDLELYDLFRNPKIYNKLPAAVPIKYYRQNAAGSIYNVGNIFTLRTKCGYNNYKVTSNVITAISGKKIRYTKITVVGYGWVLPDDTEYELNNPDRVWTWDRYEKYYNPCRNN